MFSEKDIQNIISNLPKENRKFLEEWYADLYQFSGDRDGVVTDENGRVRLAESIEMRKEKFNE